MSPTSLQEQRQVNDEICRAHGFSVLEPYDGQKRKKRLTPGEYRAAMRGESWKFRLMKAIDEALEYSPDRKSFILNMEYEGYEVRWDDAHKYILFTTPEGQKCRDRTLHDDTYLKENLEKLFAYRAEHGFTPQTPEPPEGWLAQELMDKPLRRRQARKSVENGGCSAAVTITPTDSKQKRRSAHYRGTAPEREEQNWAKTRKGERILWTENKIARHYLNESWAGETAEVIHEEEETGNTPHALRTPPPSLIKTRLSPSALCASKAGGTAYASVPVLGIPHGQAAGH